MRITSVTAEAIHGRIIPELAIVSSLGEHLVGQYVLVRIRDAEGRTGLGEASVTAVWSGETQAGAMALVNETLAPLLIGADGFDVEWLTRRMDRAVHANSFAKAAIEMALLDLQGKALGVPVSSLIGGRDPESRGIRLKFVIGAVAPAEAAQRAARMVERGWQAIKVKVGRTGECGPDVERLHAVRRAIGPDVWLSVDANGGFAPREAVTAAAEFEKLGIRLFEQPTRRGDHQAMAWVRQRSSIPIMADESVFTPLDALDVIRHNAADVLSIYPGKHGGIRATQQIAKLAEAAGIPCTIGSNLEREVATSAMAHVTLATANIDCERFPGDLIGPLYFDGPLTTQPLEYEVDRLRLSRLPGLGVQLPGED